MSTLAGAFGNLYNFLHFIALPNCIEFFRREQAEGEEIADKGELADCTRRELSRVLFNAVVALDCVLDYAFHAEGGGPDQRPFNQRVFEKTPAVEALREVANALKHCVTRNAARLDGDAITRTRYQWEVVLAENEAVCSKLSVDAELLGRAKDALGGAFRFWATQGRQMDARQPRIDLALEIPEAEA